MNRGRSFVPWRSCLPALVAAFTAQAVAAQVAAAPRGDSILVARDLDGDGRLDYVVREVRHLASPVQLETRIAVYLGRAPATRRPAWATDWAGDDEGEYHLEEAIALAKGVSLLDIAFYGGDADHRTILLVRGERARVDIEHQVNYGQGTLTVGGKGEGVFIDASLDDLEVRGVKISSTNACASSEWAMIRLRYDGAQQRFVPGQRSCVRMR